MGQDPFVEQPELGSIAIRLARESVRTFVNRKNRRSLAEGDIEKGASKYLEEYRAATKEGNLPAVFDEEYGVFCTLNTYPQGELRGCIGFPEPIFPLGQAIVQAAWNASSRDPRFFPLKPDELDKITVEVSVLTPPSLVEVKGPEELLTSIKVGRDGLIVEKGWARGLLLPQVPVEWGWTVKEFLQHTCRKGGLAPNEWLRSDVKFYSFQAHVFSEKEPNGMIVKKVLEK